jgi:hypothetical protein
MQATTPAARERHRLEIGEVRIWATLLVGAAYWENIVHGSGGSGGFSLVSAVNSILDNGAFDIFAWILLLARCFASPDRRPASSRDIIVTFSIGVMVLLPTRLVAGLALLPLAVLLFSDPAAPRSVRQMRLVLAGLAFETVWMSSLLAPLHVLAASLDAQATAALLRALGQAAAAHGNVVETIGTQFSIVIWSYCASPFPLADVCLAFAVIVLCRGHVPRRSHLPWLALSCVASVVLTEARLVLLAWDEASYQWWHYGPGMSVYALAALGLAVAAPLLATLPPVRVDTAAMPRPAA